MKDKNDKWLKIMYRIRICIHLFLDPDSVFDSLGTGMVDLEPQIKITDLHVKIWAWKVNVGWYFFFKFSHSGFAWSNIGSKFNTKVNGITGKASFLRCNFTYVVTSVSLNIFHEFKKQHKILNIQRSWLTACGKSDFCCCWICVDTVCNIVYCRCAKIHRLVFKLTVKFKFLADWNLFQLCGMAAIAERLD